VKFLNGNKLIITIIIIIIIIIIITVCAYNNNNSNGKLSNRTFWRHLVAIIKCRCTSLGVKDQEKCED